MSGYLTTSGADLSSVFMNINRYGQMNPFTGTGSNQSVSTGTCYNAVSCTLTSGTYIITLSTYNTTTSNTGTLDAFTIGISTNQTDTNTGGFQFSTGSSTYPSAT